MPVLKHLNGVDYIVIVCFLLMIAGVGVYVARYNKRTQDYFKAGGKLPWIISGLSLFVSGFSAFMFVSASGFTYRNGISGLYMFTSSFGAYWLGYFIYGRLWRRSRIDSPMEILTRRYSQSTTYFYSIAQVIPNILLMGTLIYTLCIFISSAFGFGGVHIDFGVVTLSGFEMTLIGIGVILLLYTVLGGLWAVAVTDTLQFIIMFLMTLVVFPVSFMYIGDGNLFAGFTALAERAPEGFLSFSAGHISFLYISSFWLMNAFGYNVNWHIGQRYYSIADERDTKKMAAFCAILGLVAPFLWVMPALVSRVIFPDIAALWPELTAPSEASFVSLCLLILPHGFLGVVVSAILAASMSSADSTFNWLAAVITKDVYVPLARRFRNGEAPPDKLQLIVGKLTVLTIGILAIWISLIFQKVGSSFDIYMKLYSMTTPVLFVPVMIGFVYRKTPWWSGMASAAAGIVVVLIVNVLATVAAGLPLQDMGDIFADVSFSLGGISYGKFEMNIFFGILASGGMFFLSSRWPDKAPQEVARLAALERDLQTPAHDQDVRIDPKSLQAYKLVSAIAAAVGVLLLLLSFVTGGFSEFVINALTGTGALAFSAFFWFMAKRYER